MSLENNSDLKKELLISFNQQFADNQNQHQQTFIQVLSVLLTVLIGYGYVFTNGGKLDGNEIVVKDFLLELAFVVASTINSLGIMLILNNAYSFRRDQFVVSNIRQYAGLITSGKNDHGTYIFPPSYNPKESYESKRALWLSYKKKKFSKKVGYPLVWLHHSVSWMPDFYNVLFLILAIIHFTILASFVLNPFDSMVLSSNTNLSLHWYHILAVVFWLSMTTYLCNRILFFKRKLKDLYRF